MQQAAGSKGPGGVVEVVEVVEGGGLLLKCSKKWLK